jgi:hypothetical protein
MFRSAWHDARKLWSSGSRPQRILYAAGGLLILSGVCHVGIGLLTADTWQGNLSFRKPALFGLSTGVTCLSLAWILGWLAWNRTARIVAATTAVAAVVEVGLITLQTWRGVPSHFNIGTPFDAFVNYAIDALVSVIAVVIAVITVRAFAPLRKDGVPLPPDLTLAVRCGMALLLLSCLFGFWMLAYGTQHVQSGLPPELFGEAGIVKFVHGMPMHAIQVLPVMCWMLHRLAVVQRSRTRLVALVGAGFTALTLFAGLQTFAGRGRFDFSSLSFVILAAAMLLLTSPAAYLVVRQCQRTRQPPVR